MLCLLRQPPVHYALQPGQSAFACCFARLSYRGRCGRPNICPLEEESQCAFLCALSSKCRSFLRCHSPHGCWALARRLKLGKRAVMSVMSSEHARLGTKQLAENVSRHFSSPLAATVDYTIWGRVLDVWAPNIRRTLRPPLSAKQNKTMLFVIV